MEQIKFPIKLERDIVFFDLETTGKSVYNDRIVEISAAKIKTDGFMEIKTKRVNPEMAIPASATAIHGIRNEDVANEPTFKALATSLYKFFENCDLGGYNAVRFDIPMLIEEFKRTGISTFSTANKKIIDPQIIFHKMEPRDLSAALKFYCGKELNDAHSAEADIRATVDVFIGQISKYTELPKNLDEISKLCSYKDESWIDNDGKFAWVDGEAKINFGRKQGSSLRTIAKNEPDFLQWMIKASFSDETKKIAKDAIEGRFPEKKT
jgi:DNA polymerase-3 subunit epsilon